MESKNVITFDNLRQADNKIAGQTQEVKAIRPAVAEHLSQPNCKGVLYHPNSLNDITKRASQSGILFRKMFQ